jgi:hypothetical protein
MDIGDMGDLGEMLNKMEKAYSEGLSAMDQAGKKAAEDIDPDHLIYIDINLAARIEGYQYKAEGKLTFKIGLDPIIEAGNEEDLSTLLKGLGVDMGENEDEIVNQLGNPRAVGILDKVESEKVILHNTKGKIDADLNKDATLIATKDAGKIMLNFEGVFTYPDFTDSFYAVPTTEKMHENISFEIGDIYKPVDFSWKEEDKDNLEIKGSATIKRIKQ